MDFADVPAKIFEPIRARCVALPEVDHTVDRYAHAFKVRRRVFAYAFAVEQPPALVTPMLVCTADLEERDALVASGHPFFAPRSGTNRLGVVLDAGPDWGQVDELIVDSYRLDAPKRLAALIDE